MPEATKTHGRSAEDIVEAGAGGEYYRALILTELDSATCGIEEEFAYDTSEEALELSRLVRDLRAHLERLSVTEDAELTMYRQCRRCSGDGKTAGEDPCAECGGSGSVHADEADG